MGYNHRVFYSVFQTTALPPSSLPIPSSAGFYINAVCIDVFLIHFCFSQATVQSRIMVCDFLYVSAGILCDCTSLSLGHHAQSDVLPQPDTSGAACRGTYSAGQVSIDSHMHKTVILIVTNSSHFQFSLLSSLNPIYSFLPPPSQRLHRWFILCYKTPLLCLHLSIYHNVWSSYSTN